MIDEYKTEITEIEWTGFFPEGEIPPDSEELIQNLDDSSKNIMLKIPEKQSFGGNGQIIVKKNKKKTKIAIDLARVLAASSQDISRVFIKNVYELSYKQDSCKFMSIGGSQISELRDYSIDPIERIEIISHQ